MRNGVGEGVSEKVRDVYLCQPLPIMTISVIIDNWRCEGLPSHVCFQSSMCLLVCMEWCLLKKKAVFVEMRPVWRMRWANNCLLNTPNLSPELINRSRPRLVLAPVQYHGMDTYTVFSRESLHNTCMLMYNLNGQGL